LLQYDPKYRYTCQQALEHDWFRIEEVMGHETHMDVKLSHNEIQSYLANMKTFKVTHKLKQLTYAYIVTHLLDKHHKK